MTLRPGANEIRELVRKLGSRNNSRVDDARTRLSIIGARSVDALIEALEGDNPKTRSNAMQMLVLLQHARGRDAMVGMLMERDPRVRETSVRALARFPSPDSVRALEGALMRDPSLDVRIAAVHGLIELYSAGQERAVRRVLEVLLAREFDPRVRGAAAALLPHLPPSRRRGILHRLRGESDPSLARRLAEVEDALASSVNDATPAVTAALGRLGSPEYEVWHDALRSLVTHGKKAVVPLVHEMQRRSHDPEFCARSGMVLRAMGARCGRTLSNALDHVDEPHPLQVLIEVVGALGDKALIYKLKDMIDRVRTKRGRSQVNGFDPLQRVRAKAHLELARIGSRVAVSDLVDLVSSQDSTIDLEALDALEIVGTREEIGPLLRAWRREDRTARRRIGEVVRSIMRREKIRRNSRCFGSLAPSERRALATMLAQAPRRRAPVTTKRRAAR